MKLSNTMSLTLSTGEVITCKRNGPIRALKPEFFQCISSLELAMSINMEHEKLMGIIEKVAERCNKKFTRLVLNYTAPKGRVPHYKLYSEGLLFLLWGIKKPGDREKIIDVFKRLRAGGFRIVKTMPR